MNSDLGKVYVEWCRFRLLNQYWPRVQKCVEELSQDDIWWRGHETNNSVGNLLLHLTGNLNQFVLAGIGGAPDTRNKLLEFTERQRVPKDEILGRLHQALLEADRTLGRFDPNRLLDRTVVQERDRPILEVLSIVVEHFALHVGQIIYITKLRTGKDLKF
ncbi:MAG: DUF1572 family protein [Ignavibacteriales bacterium]|nr:DUF1572 family protein [Ignavibacteriales bacterium]